MEEKERFLKLDRNDMGTVTSTDFGGCGGEAVGMLWGAVGGGKGQDWLRGVWKKGWTVHVAV